MRTEHRGITKFVQKLRHRQRRNSQHFYMEQPWRSESRKLPEIIEAVSDLDEGKLNMCMHGLVDPEQGLLIKKDT